MRQLLSFLEGRTPIQPAASPTLARPHQSWPSVVSHTRRAAPAGQRHTALLPPFADARRSKPQTVWHSAPPPLQGRHAPDPSKGPTALPEQRFGNHKEQPKPRSSHRFSLLALQRFALRDLSTRAVLQSHWEREIAGQYRQPGTRLDS